MKKLTDDINAGKGAIGKMATDQEFADKLQNTLNKLSAISDRLEKRGEGMAGNSASRSRPVPGCGSDAGRDPRPGQINPRESQDLPDHPFPVF